MIHFATISLLIISLAFPATSNDSSHCHACQMIQSEPSVQETQQVDEFLRRWKDERFKGFLDAQLWALTHTYSDSKRMEEVLKILQSYFEALDKYEKGDHSSLDQMGGIKSMKDKMASWLADNDQAIRAFAAIVLGVSGDRIYAPQVAKLLDKREYKSNNPRTDRGRAALSLGLLGAREYIQRLVTLLRSRNEYDRAGAAQGLVWLGAKDQAKAIARLLDDENEDIREIAKEALEMLGATEFIKDTKRRRRKN